MSDRAIDHGRIEASRVFTDDHGDTHVGKVELKGVVTNGEKSLVPAGCTAFFESPAVSLLIRRFPANFKTGYHNDPAHQHQLVFHLDGVAGGGCMDGTTFRLEPGDFAFVEDPTGQGHTAYDAGGAGFTQIFVSLPAE